MSTPPNRTFLSTLQIQEVNRLGVFLFFPLGVLRILHVRGADVGHDMPAVRAGPVAILRRFHVRLGATSLADGARGLLAHRVSLAALHLH